MIDCLAKGGQPLVSIVTPVYNAGKFLAETVESVLAQTHENFEHLLVDDSSRDSSAQLMRELARRDERIRLLFLEENGGPARARNRGIEASSGEFVAFLDADDLWAPQKLARQVTAFDGRPELGIVGTNGRIIDEQGRRLTQCFAADKIRRGKVSLPEFLLKGVPLATSSVVVRRECLEHCGLFDEVYRVCEDYELWMRILQFYEVDILDEELLYYRRHGNNISSSTINSRYYKILVYENQVLPQLDSYPDETASLRLRLQEMYTSYGKMLVKTGRVDEGHAYFDKAIALKQSSLVSMRAFFYKKFLLTGRKT